MEGRRLILIDDDPNVLGAITDALRQRGWKVVGRASTIDCAMQMIQRVPFHVAVMAMSLYRIDVAPLIEQLRRMHALFVLTTDLPLSAIQTT